MSADHGIRLHIRPTLPAQAQRWRGAAVLSALAVFVPVVALAQGADTGEQRLRARDLSVLEDLLSDTIQEAIQLGVQAVNVANRAEQEAAAERSETPEFRYMFRTSGETQAGGMFLEDYGVIFTVQVPVLSASPTALFVAGDTISIVTPDTLVLGELAYDIQMRSQLSRMQAEIHVLTQRLQETAEETGATSDKAQRLRASIAQLESAYAEYAAETENIREVPAAAPRTERVTTRRGGIRMLPIADPEAMADAEALVERQRTDISGSVIEAVIETFAQYGTVIHGLEGTDRLAVVLLPRRTSTGLPAGRVRRDAPRSSSSACASATSRLWMRGASTTRNSAAASVSRAGSAGRVLNASKTTSRASVLSPAWLDTCSERQARRCARARRPVGRRRSAGSRSQQPPRRSSRLKRSLQHRIRGPCRPRPGREHR